MRTNDTRLVHGALFLFVMLLAACSGGGNRSGEDGGAGDSGAGDSGAGLSSDASLAALALSTGTLSPSFNSAVLGYAASVNNGTTSVTVTATASSANATVKVNGTTLASGSASAAMALSVGANPIAVAVTAEDGTTIQTYTVTVERQAAPLSTDATLAGLVVSVGTLAPTFGSATTTYADLVPMAAASAEVTATTVGPRRR